VGGGASCVVSAVFLTESSQSRGLLDSFSLSVVFLTNLSPIDVRTDGIFLSQDVGNHMPKRWGSQGYGNLMKAADRSTVMLLLLYSILTHPAVSSHSLNVPRKTQSPQRFVCPSPKNLARCKPHALHVRLKKLFVAGTWLSRSLVARPRPRARSCTSSWQLPWLGDWGHCGAGSSDNSGQHSPQRT
jgi:hypothetical protein